MLEKEDRKKVNLRVCLKSHIVAQLLELILTSLRKRVENQRVAVAVAHQNRCLLVQVALGNVVHKRAAEKQPRREADNAANLDRGSETGQDAHSAALREAAEDDAVGGDAGCNLFLDERVEVVTGREDACGVFVAALRLN